MRTSLALRLAAAGLALPSLLQPLSAQGFASGRGRAVPVPEAAPERAAFEREARAHLVRRAFQMGLDADHDFALKNVHTEESGDAHVRMNQLYKGVRVFEGEAIVHMRNGEVRQTTDALVRRISLDVRPGIARDEALAAVHRDLAPKAAYLRTPATELVIAQIDQPHGGSRATLVYHVHTEVESAADTRHTDYFVDAHTGRVVEKWNSLHTAATTGTGNSQFYGAVTLNTNTTSGGYELRDVSGRWASPGAATYNLNHGTSGTGTIYTDVDNTWGDGGAYGSGTGTSTTGATGQTAAVDAHRGLQETYDFYKAIFGRNGIDNTGKAPYSRVHYSSSYDNAFWSDSCFCMTYGDGDPANGGSLGEADLDTVGHEVSHGLCFATANLTYRKESGGLNEGNSDIFGTCVEFWVLGGRGATVPASGSVTVGGKTVSANYKMFENSWGHAYPNEALRWQYKPSRDGASPDFYSSTIGRLDVHYSSGVANHFFFLLAHGSQVDSLCDNIASPMTNGVTSVTGIGNDKAIRIWYRALTTYMTSSTNYAGARTATLSAAKDLYGATSTEYNTVNTAWKAVGVQ